MTTIGALIDGAIHELGQRGTRLDAELLLAHCTGWSRGTLIAFPEREVGSPNAESFRAAVERRAAGVPLAYLTGTREFFSLTLAVSNDVLVPRPETETLVEAALEQIDASSARTVLDLGTGSGAIALALKHERAVLEVTGVDADDAAFRAARGNAKRLGLDVRFVRSSWFETLAGERFDLIVANPPYVPSADPHFSGPLRFEPRAALDGGVDGLAAFRSILESAHAHMTRGAALIFEHGFDQRAAVAALAAAWGFAVAFQRDDLAGQARVLALTRAS